MNPFIVAVSGEKDHGKSTLARLIAESISRQFCIETYVEHVALPMYQMAAIITDDQAFLNSPEEAKRKKYKFERIEMTGTEILQDIAQRYGRDFLGSGVWVNLWKKRVSVHPHDSIVFYPDCRMVEDRDACDMGIWISAPGVVSDQNMNHETERHLHVMKERADIQVVRRDGRYDPELRDIASKIVVKYSERTLSGL